MTMPQKGLKFFVARYILDRALVDRMCQAVVDILFHRPLCSQRSFQHLLGNAADIGIPGVSPSEVENYLEFMHPIGESSQQTLMRGQVGAMRAYQEMLNLRIAAF